MYGDFEVFIKSPLNYTGGKFKILDQIFPLFPEKITTFVDLFGGGGNVCVNAKSGKIIYNDILIQVVEFLKYCKETPENLILTTIDNIVSQYSLSKKNENGFLSLKKDYNSGNKSPMMFYSLVCHSFNNQIRFNKKGEFNLPFGRRRSSFNPVLKQKFIEFVKCIKTKNISFTNNDFRIFDLANLDKFSFLYLDPPYLISCATYNENGGWGEKDERDLLEFLDIANSKDIRFALNNVIENKGQENIILKNWSSKYNIHVLNNNFVNSNHQRTKNGNTVEVLITNYQTPGYRHGLGKFIK